jgi:hypothetical protein
MDSGTGRTDGAGGSIPPKTTGRRAFLKGAGTAGAAGLASSILGRNVARAIWRRDRTKSRRAVTGGITSQLTSDIQTPVFGGTIGSQPSNSPYITAWTSTTGCTMGIRKYFIAQGKIPASYSASGFNGESASSATPRQILCNYNPVYSPGDAGFTGSTGEFTAFKNFVASCATAGQAMSWTFWHGAPNVNCGAQIASKSNGVSVTDVTELYVSGIAGFAQTGSLTVTNSNGTCIMSYTGLDASGIGFTGCSYVSGDTGTLATGDAVVPESVPSDYNIATVFWTRIQPYVQCVRNHGYQFLFDIGGYWSERGGQNIGAAWFPNTEQPNTSYDAIVVDAYVQEYYLPAQGSGYTMGGSITGGGYAFISNYNEQNNTNIAFGYSELGMGLCFSDSDPVTWDGITDETYDDGNLDVGTEATGDTFYQNIYNYFVGTVFPNTASTPFWGICMWNVPEAFESAGGLAGYDVATWPAPVSDLPTENTPGAPSWIGWFQTFQRLVLTGAPPPMLRGTATGYGLASEAPEIDTIVWPYTKGDSSVSLQAGDLMLLWCIAPGTGLTWMTSAGFTAITPASGNGQSAQLLWKYATATDATNAENGNAYTISLAGGATKLQVVIAAAYYNVNQTNPFDGSVSSGQTNAASPPSTTLTVPGITTAESGDLLLWFGGVKATAAGGVPAAISQPADFAQELAQVNDNNGSTGTNMGAMLASMIQMVDGATGDQNGTVGTSSETTGLLLGLQAAS